MQCKQCGSNLVRGFSFCLECGLPVPPEMLEESGLPQRNTDSGAPNASETPNAASEDAEQETIEELQPQLQGGEQDAGAELKPQLQGGEGETSGKALKPQLMGIGDEESGEALKPKFVGGEYDSGGGENVRAALQETSSSSSDSSSEKLVFCPNCGTRMQQDPHKCEKCGMVLGNAPRAPQAASSGIPLFNTDSDPFGMSGFGGFSDSMSDSMSDSIGDGIGGAGGISEDEAASIDSFVNGSIDSLFNSGSSEFNVQASPGDFAQLTEQLANFSAGATMPSIEVTESTQIRQREPGKGEEREVIDFSMSDDLSAETVPMSDNSMPVLGDYSMEEDPNADVVLDPYAFLNTSMDESDMSDNSAEESTSAPAFKAAEKPVEKSTAAPVFKAAEKPVEKAPSAPVFKAAEKPIEKAPETPVFNAVEKPNEKAPVTSVKAPEKTTVFGGSEVTAVVPPPNPFADDEFVPEEAPFIAETAPIIEEFKPQAPAGAQNTPPASKPQINSVKKDGGSELPEPLNIAAKPTDGIGLRRPQPVSGSANYGIAPEAASVNANAPAAPRTNVPQAPRPNVRQAFPTVKCPLCSRQMAPNDKFCSSCGRSVSGEVNPHLSEVPHRAPSASKLNYLPILIAVIVVIAVVIMIVTAANAHAAEIYQSETFESVESFEEAVCTQISDLDLL